MFTHHKPEILFRQKLKLLQPCAIDGSYYMEIILKNETYQGCGEFWSKAYFSGFLFNTNLYTISNNIEVYEEPVRRTMNISHHAVKFEACEEDRIVQKFVLITPDRKTGESHE